MLIPQGVDDARCWLVVTGAVASFVVAPTGRRALLEILGPGDLAMGAVSPMAWRAGRGGDPAADPDPVRPELRALAPGGVVVVPGADLARAAEAEPGLLAWVHECAVARLHRTQASLADALTLPVHQRLHRFLLRLAGTHGRVVPGGTRIGVPLTQDTLAAAVGAARETANRAVRALEAEGLLARTGRTYTLTGNPATEPAGTTTPDRRRVAPGLRSPA